MVDRPRAAPLAGPLGFLSDIHGNLPALNAALGELERRGVRDVFVAGDLLLGGDDPVGVYQRLRSVGARSVRGMSDRALVSIDADDLNPQDDADREKLEAFRATQRAVGEVTLKYLEQMPDMLRLPLVDGREVVLVHGSPSDPSIEMGHDLDDAELFALIADDPADFIVCGSTHVPFQRVLDGVHVINVGSVGAAPGDPVAHFTTMTIRLDETTVEQDFVAYEP